MASIKVTPGEEKSDRFHRFKLIGWWNQEKLSSAKVLVVGAGALGNEIIKNLALLGVGNIFIADFDTIENSNLSRSILFRERDNECAKAMIAAKAAKDIYPEIKIQYSINDAGTDLGLGVYKWADVILCGLDSREARLRVNKAAHKVKKPWIDGAIEGLSGIARVFLPLEGPCYECTMNNQDWKLLQSRRACNLLTKEQMLEGKTPTTPTISSIIAGIQCQEFVKLVHGLDNLCGGGIVFNGLTNDVYTVNYKRKNDCYGHYSFPTIISIKKRTRDLTINNFMEVLKKKFKSNSLVVELNTEYVNEVFCPKCSYSKEIFVPISRVKKDDLLCGNCGEEAQFETINSIYGDESFLHRTFHDIGIPPYEIIGVRTKDKSFAVLFSGDSQTVLGELDE